MLRECDGAGLFPAADAAAMAPGGSQLAAGGVVTPARGQSASHVQWRALCGCLVACFALTAGAQAAATAYSSEVAAAQQWNQQFAWLLREGQQPPLPPATVEMARGAETDEHRRLQSKSFTPPVRHCAACPLCACGRS